MAEALVLANLTVDSSGVAGGINQANASLQQGQLVLGRFGAAQTQVASTTTAVTARLFTFRAALLTVARSFGVVGIIIGLAAALKALITDLVTSTTWFQKASTAVNDWYRSLILGESGVDRLMRKMKEASEGGAASLLETLEKFKALGRQRAATQAAAEGLPFFDTVNLAIAKADLVTINEEMIKLADRLQAAGISRDALFKATGFQVGISASGLPGAAAAAGRAAGGEAGELQGPQTILEQMGLPGPGVAEARVAEIVSALKFMQANAAAIFGPSRAQIIEGMADALKDVGLNAQQIGEIFASLGIPIEQVTEAIEGLNEEMGELPAMSEQAQASLSVMQTAMQSVASTMSQALISGSLDGKEALASLMADISRACFAYAAMFVASGIAASTGIGAAVLQGTPAQFFKAAGLFAAAGVAAGLVARGLGAGGSGAGEGGGSGAGEPGAVGGTGGGGTSVSVIVHGSLIGSSEDDLARSLERLLRTARGDGG